MTFYMDNESMATPYNKLEYTAQDIAFGKYRQCIGNGKKWEERGRMQLDLLVAAGLAKNHRLIDIGCGPLRAGTHFIRYLNSGNYVGFDYSPAYIGIARTIVSANESLSGKQPVLLLCENFDLSPYAHSPADFGIAFSVLNQCKEADVKNFFHNLGKSFNTGARIFAMVDNEKWYPKWVPASSDLQVVNTYTDLSNFGIDISGPMELSPKRLQMYGKKFLIELEKT